MRELIAQYGVHAGTSRRCTCCEQFMLYRVPVAGAGAYFLACSRCDTEQ